MTYSRTKKDGPVQGPVREIRRSQTISPFGVGAIFDFKDESFIGMDVSRWSGEGRNIDCPRLSRRIGKALREAQAKGLPYLRFPRWLVCRRCRRLINWTAPNNQKDEPVAPRCGQSGCQGALIPMRFVMVCEDGHLSDIPWSRWVSLGVAPGNPYQATCKHQELSFRSTPGGGGGLNSLYIECSDPRCKRRRTLNGLMSAHGLKGIRCSGRQPWYTRAMTGDPCIRPARAVQRGETDLYNPVIETALDIPPDSDYDPAGEDAARIRLHVSFPALQNAIHQKGQEALLVRMLAAEIASALLSEDTADDPVILSRMTQLVFAVAMESHAGSAPGISSEEEDLLAGEWRALTVPNSRPVHPQDRFQVEHTTLLNSERAAPPGSSSGKLDALISGVVLVRRLREVRALTGFTRGNSPVIPVGSPVRAADFVPAIETYGEGIFLRLNEDALAVWQKHEQPLIQPRIDLLNRRKAGSNLQDPENDVTPRFVVLHTLAHLLIRQLAFEAGYASSSLRERIYSADPNSSGSGAMAGILIYTAAGDQQGTLGGLVRLGEPPHLAGTLLNALAAGQWCSSDPVCGESQGQGVLGLNLAACHACALVSETSCVHRNMLLDRVLLMGNESQAGGYFSSVLDVNADLYEGEDR